MTKTANTPLMAPCPRNSAATSRLNFSNDGLVYAADRMANRIDVTTKEGKFMKEFIMAPMDGHRRFHRRRHVLARQGAEIPVYFRSDQ